MIVLWMLAAAEAAAPANAIEAERAFVTDAHTIGQWVAFTKWSTPDALVFGPQPENAHAALKGLPEPKVPIFWWPGRSYASCDGTLAVNTGPWVRQAGKKTGFFTTVWRQADGQWRWVYDGGGDTPTVRAEGGEIQPIVAACDAERLAPPAYGHPADFVAPVKTGGGLSADSTLAWSWVVDARGARQFVAQQRTRDGWSIVIHDLVPAPPAP